MNCDLQKDAFAKQFKSLMLNLSGSMAGRATGTLIQSKATDSAAGGTANQPTASDGVYRSHEGEDIEISKITREKLTGSWNLHNSE